MRRLRIIVRGSQWDGKFKQLTKDCETCNHFKIVKNNEKRCYVGISWKRLFMPKPHPGTRSQGTLRKCPFANGPKLHGKD